MIPSHAQVLLNPGPTGRYARHRRRPHEYGQWRWRGSPFPADAEAGPSSLDRRLEPAGDGRGVRDGRADDDGESARPDGRRGVPGRVDAALADHRHTGELLDDAGQQFQVRPLGLLTVPRVTRQRRRNDVGTRLDGAPGIPQGPAVRHDQGPFPLQLRDGLGVVAPVGAGAAGGVDGDDIRARHHACPRVAQARGDVDAVVPLLPQADDGHLHTALDGRDVRQPPATDRGGAPDLGGARDLRHRLGVAHGLAGVRLHG